VSRRPFRPWHDLRHSALTHEAAAGNPQVYVQLKAGHSQGSITERYIHAAQVLFPGAAERAEERMFGTVETSRPRVPKRVPKGRLTRRPFYYPPVSSGFQLPGLDSNQQPSG
jgi:hypothetical protein